MVKCTNSDLVKDIINKIKLQKRLKVKEVTLDMAPTMERIVRLSFPNAAMVTDRFHVQKLAYDAVQ
jgi:transposase